MGQVLHGSATTTEAVRRAIQHSQASLRTLARRHGINPKTVAKWKKRTSTADVPTGPKEAKSTVLTIEQEAVIVAFRRHTLLPLDDCLYALQASIPNLTRSSLHRCLQRHGISRLPQIDGEKTAKSKFKTYPIGFFHIDIAEVRTEEGKLHLFVGIDRTSKFAFVELHEKATTRVGNPWSPRPMKPIAVSTSLLMVIALDGDPYPQPRDAERSAGLVALWPSSGRAAAEQQVLTADIAGQPLGCRCKGAEPQAPEGRSRASYAGARC